LYELLVRRRQVVSGGGTRGLRLREGRASRASARSAAAIGARFTDETPWWITMVDKYRRLTGTRDDATNANGISTRAVSTAVKASGSGTPFAHARVVTGAHIIAKKSAKRFDVQGIPDRKR